MAEPLLVLATVAIVRVTCGSRMTTHAMRPVPIPAAVQSVTAPISLAAPAATFAAAQRFPPASPRFLVPVIARSGEEIAVVGHRQGELCGPTALHFDDTLIPHQLRRVAWSADRHWVELYLTVAIPAAAAPGSHRLALFGPVPGGRGGELCGETSEHNGRLADSEIIVMP